MTTLDKIKELIEQLGSHEALAAKLNVTTGAVWKWINEDRTPHRSTRIQIERLHKRLFANNSNPVAK